MPTVQQESSKCLDKNHTLENHSHHERSSQHFWSTLALCSSSLAMFYQLFNVFPYSGYMVIHLIPGVDNENAGFYAGMLASSFMVGRACSAYAWGQLADIYGRKFVLIVSLLISSIGSLAFGCSTTFFMAVLVRFIMGLGNGIMIACRTAISELAKGDRELESKGVGLLMSMVGYGMLLSPSLGGLLSEPLRQYPDIIIMNGTLDSLLTNYPFLLPNLLGGIVSLVSLLTVIGFVQETLPTEQRRHWIHVGPDLMMWFARLFQTTCGHLFSRQENSSSTTNNNTPSSTVTSHSVDDIDEEEWENDMKMLDSEEFVAAAALMATRNSRASYTNALHHRTSATHRASDAALSRMEQQPDRTIHEGTPLLNTTPPQTTHHTSSTSSNNLSMTALLQKDLTRKYLVSYWVIAFASVCQTETFPLFAMSHLGGLGLEEKSIGLVGTLAGLVFCIGQYFSFTQAMKVFGLVGALRFGAFWGSVPVVFMPFSLFLSGWVQLSYLAFIIGTLMICNGVYLGCNTIGANRTVDASQRAAMNGLSSLGTSVSRGLGPITAGVLVAFSMTSGVIPPALGGWFIYLILGFLGLFSYYITLSIPEEKEDAEYR